MLAALALAALVAVTAPARLDTSYGTQGVARVEQTGPTTAVRFRVVQPR